MLYYHQPALLVMADYGLEYTAERDVLLLIRYEVSCLFLEVSVYLRHCAPYPVVQPALVALDQQQVQML